MRDPSSTLPQGLKRRIAARLAKLNNSTYCVSHHCGMLQREDSGDKLKDEGWELSDEAVRALIAGGKAAAKDEFERACFAFAEAMTVDPTGIPDEVYERVKRLLTPPQIVELACVVGFWKFYNTVHSGLKVPLEKHLLEFSGWITVE
jgi:alkylhydroperoxidase family enzyme